MLACMFPLDLCCFWNYLAYPNGIRYIMGGFELETYFLEKNMATYPEIQKELFLREIRLKAAVFSFLIDFDESRGRTPKEPGLYAIRAKINYLGDKVKMTFVPDRDKEVCDDLKQ